LTSKINDVEIDLIEDLLTPRLGFSKSIDGCTLGEEQLESHVKQQLLDKTGMAQPF